MIKGLLIISRNGVCNKDGFSDPNNRTTSLSVIMPIGFSELALFSRDHPNNDESNCEALCPNCHAIKTRNTI